MAGASPRRTLALALTLLACRADDGDAATAADGDTTHAGVTTDGANAQCVEDPDRSIQPCGDAEGRYFTPATQETLVGCTDVPGLIHVSDDPTAVDATRFTALRHVGRLTFFRDEALTSLDGLQQLRLAGTFGLSNMYVLTDLGALAGLCEVTDQLYVDNSPMLQSLEGLHHVQTVGTLRLSYLQALRDLDGLRGLVHVTGDLVIEGNASLPAADIEAFVARVQVDGEITIADNG